jgi:hypothetical protein
VSNWLAGVTRQNFGTNGGSFTGGPRKIVVHTTETLGWPGYAGGATCPHFTVRWNGKTLEVRQHVPLNVASRALRNPPGGVQTNRDSAFQIEVVGTCDAGGASHKAGAFLWDTASDAALKALGQFIGRLARETGTSLVVAKSWVDYPTSYGSGGQRFSLSQWDNFSGVCGHQHVPENTHGDPGAMNVPKALTLAGYNPITGKPRPIPVPERHPKFPLPRGHWFGSRTSTNPRSHSGYEGATDRQALRTWQARMRKRGWKIDVDGLYGPQTRSVAMRFQKSKGLPDTGGIGVRTWDAAWTEPITG